MIQRCLSQVALGHKMLDTPVESVEEMQDRPDDSFHIARDAVWTNAKQWQETIDGYLLQHAMAKLDEKRSFPTIYTPTCFLWLFVGPTFLLT